MNKTDSRLIYILLLVIIVSSLVLIFKINSVPKYDEKVFEEVYKEYEQIISQPPEQINIVDENDETEDNTIYIYQNARGVSHRITATITIPKIHYNAPIILETSDEYLKIAPTKLFGPEPNQIGNFCIVGHNYKNDSFFSNLYKLEIGDLVRLSDRKNNQLTYTVYDKYEVLETDLSCTSQDTNGEIELTLITCTKQKNKRLVVKCIAS